VLTVGLTGGIGAGKSMAAARLAALGAVVIDADALARAVVEPGTEGFARVVEEFGPDVLNDSGALDRPRLAGIVFADPAARHRLEAIVHPLIRAATAGQRAAAPPDAIVVNDVPLLVESGRAGEYDVVVVVQAAVDERLRRLVARGLTADDASRRIAIQASDAERRAVANYLIDNDGTPDDLVVRVDRVWQHLLDRQREKNGENGMDRMDGRA
jgi:dephospho-CoA kinase